MWGGITFTWGLRQLTRWYEYELLACTKPTRTREGQRKGRCSTTDGGEGKAKQLSMLHICAARSVASGVLEKKKNQKERSHAWGNITTEKARHCAIPLPVGSGDVTKWAKWQSGRQKKRNKGDWEEGIWFIKILIEFYVIQSLLVICYFFTFPNNGQ